MNNLTVFEFQMNPQPKPKPSADSAGMAIRIAVGNGENIIVTGVSDGEQYEGQLVLRKKGSKGAKSVPANNLGENADPGGDECYMDGRWYNPCPVRPT